MARALNLIIYLRKNNRKFNFGCAQSYIRYIMFMFKSHCKKTTRQYRFQYIIIWLVIFRLRRILIEF